MSSKPPSGRVAKSSSATGLILTLVTCGLYELFVWWPDRMRAMNDLLGRAEFAVGKAILLSLVTCGLMYVYYDYKLAEAVLEVRRKNGEQGAESLPLVTVILDIFGMGFISAFMHQEEINKLV